MEKDRLPLVTTVREGNEMNTVTMLAIRRADAVEKYRGKRFTPAEHSALVDRLIASAAPQPKAAKVNIGGLWLQPMVAQQSRLPFNVDLTEDDEWTDDMVEIDKMMSRLPLQEEVV